MSGNVPVSIRFSYVDRERLEHAAALAGFSKLGPYIRSQVLDKLTPTKGSNDNVDTWADRHELMGRLNAIEASQKATNAMLTTLVYLAQRKATSGEINDFRVAVEQAQLSTSAVEKLSPELGQLIKQLQEN
ncbi:MAG: conjugal transfer protein TraA [Janthinobacterium lividum]